MAVKQNKTYALISNKKNLECYAKKTEQFIDEVIQDDKLTKAVLNRLKVNDTLVVENIRFLGASISEIVATLKELCLSGVNLYLAEENLSFKANKLYEFATSLTIASDLHRKLISINTREALTSIKSKGKKLGHPFGTVLAKKLDDYKDEIKEMLAVGVTKASIAKKYNVCWKTVNNFVKNNPELLLGENDGR